MGYDVLINPKAFFVFLLVFFLKKHRTVKVAGYSSKGDHFSQKVSAALLKVNLDFKEIICSPGEATSFKNSLL